MQGAAWIVAIGLAAAIQAPPAPSNSGSQACDSDRIAALVGKKWTERDRAVVLQRSGARRLRVYVRGTPVTLDYSPDRLNIETNAKGRITRLGCG